MSSGYRELTVKAHSNGFRLGYWLDLFHVFTDYGLVIETVNSRVSEIWVVQEV